MDHNISSILLKPKPTIDCSPQNIRRSSNNFVSNKGDYDIYIQRRWLEYFVFNDGDYDMIVSAWWMRHVWLGAWWSCALVNLVI